VNGFRWTLLALAAALVARPSAAAKIAWSRDYAAATAAAKKQHRLVMVDMYTDWCTWCKRLDQDTFTDPKVVKLVSAMVPVKLDAEKGGKRLAEKHGVTGFPTVLFLDGDGGLEATVEGYKTADQFAAELLRIAQDHAQCPRLEARVRSNPKDFPSTLHLLSIYAGRGAAEKAVPVLERARKSGLSGDLLVKSCFAVGSALQRQEKYQRATTYFRAGIANTRVPALVAFARLNLAGCYLGLGRVRDAVPELQAVSSLPGAPAEARQRAREVLQKFYDAVGGQ
jgi:thioredoxin-related protein